MRRLEPDGVCACCGRGGAVFRSTPSVLDFGVPTIPPLEAEILPDLCDTCDYAQQRWDAWHGSRYLGYPYADPPPKSPPVRRPAA